MSDSFEKTINDCKYFFELISFENDTHYKISFQNNDKHDSFEMKKNPAGKWEIQGDKLPDFVTANAIELNDAIEENRKDPLS